MNNINVETIAVLVQSVFQLLCTVHKLTGKSNISSNIADICLWAKWSIRIKQSGVASTH